MQEPKYKRGPYKKTSEKKTFKQIAVEESIYLELKKLPGKSFSEKIKNLIKNKGVE